MIWWISKIEEYDNLWMWHTKSPLARCYVFSYHSDKEVCPKCLAGEPEYKPINYFPSSDAGTMCHESTFI